MTGWFTSCEKARDFIPLLGTKWISQAWIVFGIFHLVLSHRGGPRVTDMVAPKTAGKGNDRNGGLVPGPRGHGELLPQRQSLPRVFIPTWCAIKGIPNARYSNPRRRVFLPVNENYPAAPCINLLSMLSSVLFNKSRLISTGITHVVSYTMWMGGGEGGGMWKRL